MEMADLVDPAGVVAAGGIAKHKQQLTQKKSRAAVSAGEAAGGQQPPADACFDCNICLDFAADPVVTLCGHLYCWPCIYKWLRPDCAEDAESDLDGPSSVPRQQQCPVCKAALSESALVPLYGRGICDKDSEGSTALAVPRRPLPSALPLLREDSGALQPRVSAHSSARSATGRNYLGGVMSSTVAHPLFHGVAVLPFLLSGSGADGGSSSQMYYPDMYYGAGRGVAERRQEMHSARSLQRVSGFLFLCVVLCLLLF